MTLANARPRDRMPSRRQSLVRAQLLLEEALHLLDDYADAPELGARLDEILVRLRERLADPLDARGEQGRPNASVSDGLR